MTVLADLHTGFAAEAALSIRTHEQMLRDLHRRFEEVDLYRGISGRYHCSCIRRLRDPRDGRLFAPLSSGDTAQEAVERMWRNT